MTYHKHIDGLRAIAIAWVLAFHYFPSVFTGGFIGVDAFFVISGYLISGIIWHDLREDRFSFGYFFGRRIRRLFPAPLLVLTVTLVLGSTLLHNQEFRQLAKHVFAASLYLNNWVLSIEKGCFDIGSEYKPLLHLWSLSIEEQFYLLWPGLIVLINRGTSSDLSKSSIIAGIFLL
jgi:peptidoglycan/LPS O-acetylase OafA/YrhL